MQSFRWLKLGIVHRTHLTYFLALLRRNGLHLCHRLYLLWRCLRHCKIRSRYLSNGRPTARPDCQEYV